MWPSTCIPTRKVQKMSLAYVSCIFLANVMWQNLVICTIPFTNAFKIHCIHVQFSKYALLCTYIVHVHGSFHGVGAQNVTWWSKIQHQYNHVNWSVFCFLGQFKQQFYDYFDWTIHFSIFAGKKRKTQIPTWLGHQILFSEKLFNLNSN